MRNKIIIVLILLLFFSCKKTSNFILQPGVTSPKEIPGINGHVWEDISSWPKKIKKGDLKYHITYIGETRDKNNVNIHTNDFNKIDTSYGYSAYYELIITNDNFKNDDLSYGPQFVWSSNGLIIGKSFIDENFNSESYWYDKTGEVIEIDLFDHRKDLRIIRYYNVNKEQIGQMIVQFEVTPSKKMHEEYSWEGKKVTKGMFCEHVSRFKERLRQQGRIVKRKSSDK